VECTGGQAKGEVDFRQGKVARRHKKWVGQIKTLYTPLIGKD